MADKEFTTSLSQWTNTFTGLVTKDFAKNDVIFDDYSKKCAMAAMSTIYNLVSTSDTSLQSMDTSNLREIVGQCASLKLNANAIPRECYFQIVNKKVGGQYVKAVEMAIEGDGNDALLRNFGSNVKTVYPVWLVKEGDEFEYPKHKGIKITDPEWTECGLSDKVVRVVYPVELNNGNVEYLIAERNSVKVNLFAHVRNNLRNEVFDVLKGTNSKGKPKTRFDATEEEKKLIEAKKQEIYEALRKCETVEDMIACEAARPYISAAWLDTPEAMIIRKMRNNAIKKYPKDMNGMAKASFLAQDETYVSQMEEAEEAEKEELDIID